MGSPRGVISPFTTALSGPFCVAGRVLATGDAGFWAVRSVWSSPAVMPAALVATTW